MLVCSKVFKFSRKNSNFCLLVPVLGTSIGKCLSLSRIGIRDSKILEPDLQQYHRVVDKNPRQLL